jgi:pyrroline-5-carboxylate reductase
VKPILLIGAGRMGGALLRGWTRAGIGPLRVVEPKPSLELRKLARASRIRVYNAVEQASPNTRACVIAIKPQIFRTEAVRFSGFAQSGSLMISIAAGTSLKVMRRAWGKRARIIRAMPNMPGSIGRGISALYAASTVTAADRKLAEQLLSALGDTLWVGKEFLIDSVTAVSGSGPAYVFLLAEALEQAAQAEGLPRKTAEKLACATVSGAGALLQVGSRTAAELRRDVTSPGGTTEAALKILMSENGLKRLLAEAVHAARKRAEELAS